MLLEIEAEMPREVVALGGRSVTSAYSVDPAVTTAEREAASGTWAIGDPFADDTLHDDGNSLFPADDGVQPATVLRGRRDFLICGDRRAWGRMSAMLKRRELPPRRPDDECEER